MNNTPIFEHGQLKVKVGDVISFVLHSRLDAPVLTGVVEYGDGVGFYTWVEGREYFLSRLMEIKVVASGPEKQATSVNRRPCAGELKLIAQNYVASLIRQAGPYSGSNTELEETDIAQVNAEIAAIEKSLSWFNLFPQPTVVVDQLTSAVEQKAETILIRNTSIKGREFNVLVGHFKGDVGKHELTLADCVANGLTKKKFLETPGGGKKGLAAILKVAEAIGVVIP